MEIPPIVAYRVWRYDYNGKLASTGHTHTWESVSTIAICNHGCDIALCLSEHNCSCGLYSLKNLSDFRNMGIWGEIYGQISLHGVVAEFEKGYRSEMAIIQVLYCDDLDICDALMQNYPGVRIESVPEILKPKMESASNYEDSYKKRQKVLAERKAEVDRNKKLYPFGFAAEKTRVQTLLRNKSLGEVRAFAKEYGESKEWAPRIWAWKPENSRKYKVGSIVFASNDDQVPYFYIGSTRAPSAQSSIRLLLSREGVLVKRTNIRNWDEDDQYKEQRAIAVANW